MLFLLACFPLALSAATIEWGAAAAISSASDVKNSGTLIEAFNAGADSVTDQTVNGVLFTGTGTLLDLSSTTDAFSGSTGEPAYDALLSAIDFGNGAAEVSLTVGGGQLVPDTDYMIQVWYVHSGKSGRVMQIGDGGGNTVDLSAVGQFSTGRFTAGSTSQTLTLLPSGMTQSHFTAYQIRSYTTEPTPTPTT